MSLVLETVRKPRGVSLLHADLLCVRDTAYVFLGNIRNRMTDIFWDPSSPFYHSAAALPVGEIEGKDFFAFLSTRFATGKRTLSKEMYDAIASLARNTPGYVQELFDTLWEETGKGEAIDPAAILRALNGIFAREQDHYEIFIRRLTALQLRVLRTLAMREGNGIYSGETLAAAQVYNSASMKRAVEKLIKDNLIYTFEGEYRFANSFFREWLKRN